MTAGFIRILAALAACLAPATLSAAECRLALAIAMDVSSSVDPVEYRLQRDGLAASLLAPEVQQAFLSGGPPVALAVFEWSGRYNQALVQDWRFIRGRSDLGDVAAAVLRSPRSSDDFPTAMGYALGYGAGLLRRGPDCLFRTIDVAGDGENNEGFRPGLAYANFPFAGVVVNGLVVNAGEYEAEIGLIGFYREEVLHGPGAFLEIADGFEDFERAMRRKLERELRPRVVGGVNPRFPDG